MAQKITSIQSSVRAAALFIIVIWAVKLLETAFGWNLVPLGVFPRNADGLTGILTAPLIHGSWQHLMSNTRPLLVLGSILVFGYPSSRWWTLLIIWLLSGTGVWLLGRESYHVGASGITHGMFFYLLVGGLLRRDRRSTALLMIAFFMYSGMLLSIFPREPGVSFEYHLFGAIAGLLCAIAFRSWDPKPARKFYSWERQAAGAENLPEEEDPFIGDQWKVEPTEKTH